MGGLIKGLLAQIQAWFGIYNVAYYGADKTGANDSTSAIQNAINAAGAKGGTVVIPPGTFLVTSTINVSNSNVTVKGSGEASIITCNFASGNIIYAGTTTSASTIENVVFKNFAITSSVKKTSGSAIYTQYAQRFKIKGVKADPAETTGFNLYDGFTFNAFDSCEVSGVVLNVSHYGLSMYGLNNQTWGADFYVFGGNKISTNNIAGSYGVYIGGAVGGLVLDETDVIECNVGVRIDEVTANANNRELFFGKCFIDSSGNHGIDIGDNGVTFLHMIGTWVASSGKVSNGGFPNGCNINTSATQMSTMNAILAGCRLYNAEGSGAVINAGAWEISGCAIHNNGMGTAGGHGIALYNANVKDVTVSGCTIANNGNATLGEGVRVVSGVTNYSVKNNVIDGNGTMAVNDQAGVRGAVKNNSGYITENWGVSNFNGTGTQTAFVVPHGLVGTPNAVNVTPLNGVSASSFYVSYDATNITITFLTAPASGTNNISFSWDAKI